MTKKDYELLVRAIRAWRLYGVSTKQERESLVAHLSGELAADSPKFNPERFYEACLGPLTKETKK